MTDDAPGRATPAGSDELGLVRAMGRWSLTAVVVNGMVGSGVFGLPAPLTGLAGSWSPATVLVAGLAVFVVVLCFAEVASRFDRAGGPYLYARETFGPAFGFQIGWLHLWTRLLSAAAVLHVLAAYLAVLLPWVGTAAGRAAAITAAIALVTAVNVGGVRQAAWTVNAFTIAKLLPLVALIGLGLIRFDPAVAATQAVDEPRWTEAVLLLVFAFGGFESAVVGASESRDPRRDMPFALIVGMAIVTVLYCLVQLVVVGVLPYAAADTAPVSSALGRLAGPAGIWIGSVAVVVSTYGWLIGFALASPRIMFAMAARGDLPRLVARVHPRTHVPDVAIALNAALALGLGLVSDFAQLATFAAIARLGILAMTCAALVVLRRRHGVSSAFRAPGGRGLALAGIVFCAWLLTTRSLAEAWFLPVILGSGLAIWAVRRRRAVSTVSA